MLLLLEPECEYFFLSTKSTSMLALASAAGPTAGPLLPPIARELKVLLLLLLLLLSDTNERKFDDDEQQVPSLEEAEEDDVTRFAIVLVDALLNDRIILRL